MKTFLAMAALVLPLAVQAQDGGMDAEAVADGVAQQKRACVSPTVLVPPFNSSPEALEQSRIAATRVEATRASAGLSSVDVCRTSAITPQISRIEGVEEEVIVVEEADASAIGNSETASASGA